MPNNFQVPPIQRKTDESVSIKPIVDYSKPQFVKVSTLQADVANKGRLGTYLAIIALLFLIFAFLLIGAIGTFQTTGNLGIIFGLCSLIPLTIGGTLAVRGILAYRAQPPQVINIEAKIIRIEKIMADQQRMHFVPVLSYVYNGHVIENPCVELAHEVPDYQINTSVIIPIDTTDPRIFWINSKPRPIVPKSLYVGLGIFAAGMVMLIVPLFL